MLHLVFLITVLNVDLCHALYKTWESSSADIENEQRHISNIVLQASRGCHFIVVTQGNGYSATPVILGNWFRSSNPLVVIDVDQIGHRQIMEGLTRDLWGSPTFTCRAMLIDFTGEDNNFIIRFLDTIKLWKKPDTKLIIIGKRPDAKSLLQHTTFKNSLYILFVRLQDKPAYPPIILTEDSKLRAGKDWSNLTHSQGYFLRLYSRCLYCNDGRPQLRFISSWSLGSKIPPLYPSLSEQLDNFHGVRLRISSLPYFPYSNFKVDSNWSGGPVTLLDCVDKRAFDEFASRVNFSYVVITPKILTPGKVDADGNWNGAFGIIQRQEADLSTTTAVFEERLEISEYERVYTMDEFIIVSLKPQLLPRYLVLIRPYTVVVWISILVSIVVWGLSLWALQRSRSYFAPDDPWPLTATLFYGSAFILEKTPSRPVVNFSGQVLLGWWLVGCFLLSAGYKSSLVAHLTVQGKTSPIDEYYDFVSRPGWRWGCDYIVLNGVGASYFKKSTTSIVQQVYRKVESVDIGTGLKKVLQGQYSLLTSRNRIRTEIESKYTDDYGQTPFYLSKHSYNISPDLGWAFRKGAPLRFRFATLANRLIEGGIINYWLNDVMDSGIKTIRSRMGETLLTDRNEGDDDKVILQMEHMVGVFLTYLLGIFISFIVFMIEKVLIRYSPIQHLQGTLHG